MEAQVADHADARAGGHGVHEVLLLGGAHWDLDLEVGQLEVAAQPFVHDAEDQILPRRGERDRPRAGVRGRRDAVREARRTGGWDAVEKRLEH